MSNLILDQLQAVIENSSATPEDIYCAKALSLIVRENVDLDSIISLAAFMRPLVKTTESAEEPPKVLPEEPVNTIAGNNDSKMVLTNDSLIAMRMKNLLPATLLIQQRRVHTDQHFKLLVSELLMEINELRSKLTESEETVLSKSQALAKAKDIIVGYLPKDTSQLSVTVTGFMHTGKSLLSALIARHLKSLGIAVDFIDDDQLSLEFFNNLSDDYITKVFTGEPDSHAPKTIFIRNRGLSRNVPYALDPVVERECNKS